MLAALAAVTAVLADVTGREMAANTFVISFDDGPNNTTTPLLLDALKKHDVKAFFNLVGVNVDNGELLKRMVGEGHIMGSHTWSHAHLRGRKRAFVDNELERTERAFQATLGDRPWFFRAPYGEWGEEARKSVADRGYTVLGWDLDTVDWRMHAPVDVISALDAFDGSHGIILMHEYTWTTSAVDEALTHMKRHGHRIAHPLDALSGVERTTLVTRSCNTSDQRVLQYRTWCPRQVHREM